MGAAPTLFSIRSPPPSDIHNVRFRDLSPSAIARLLSGAVLFSGAVMADLTYAPTPAPPGDDVWAAARRSFLGGASLPLAAERHGVNLRTLQRRAAAEGWREAAAAQRRALEGRLGGPDPEAELAANPELAAFVEAHGFEVGQLLLEPTPDRLARFAFRKAGECAAAGEPVAAQAWMRLTQGVLHAGPRLDRLRLPFAEADYMRAMYAAALRGEGGPPKAEVGGVVPPVVSPESCRGDTPAA